MNAIYVLIPSLLPLATRCRATRSTTRHIPGVRLAAWSSVSLC